MAKPIVNHVEIVEKAGAVNWVKPVVKGEITSSFGKRINPIRKKEEFHNGIDIGVPTGTQAFAVADGTILETGSSPTWGKYIKYQVNGYSVFYAHLSSLLVEEGDYVKQSQVIAKTGSTGLSTGPHLHLTIYENEKETDPIFFFDYKLGAGAKAEYEDRGEQPPAGY